MSRYAASDPGRTQCLRSRGRHVSIEETSHAADCVEKPGILDVLGQFVNFLHIQEH